MKKKKPDPRSQQQLKSVAQPIAQVAAVEDDFWADPKRRDAIRLLVGGLNKSAVAKQLGVHRNTIDNWCKDHRFAVELTKRHQEHVSSKRQQRLMATNRINDINERVTTALGMKIESSLKIDHETGLPTASEKELGTGAFDKNLRRYREIASDFREMREQERIDIGDDVHRVEVNSQHTITGDVHVAHSRVNETSFVDYVRKAIDTKIIDAKCIDLSPGASEGQFLLQAAEHILVDTDVLDKINEEDMAIEEARKK